jgi:hypothetical protein
MNDYLETQRDIRRHALEMATRSSVPGTGTIAVVDRAHYYAHYLNGDSTVNCNNRCPFAPPKVTGGLDLGKD